MTDKVQKIKEYLVGMAGAACCDAKTKKAIKANILPFIDSLQEEPKKCMYSKDDYTDEDRKVLCDGCEEECKYSKSDDFTKALAECIHQAQGNVVDPMVLAETWKDELIKLAQSEEPVSKEWIKELQDKLDSLSKEDFKKVWAKYSRYGEESSVNYDKLITMLNDALSKETKESWNKRLSEEHVSEGLEEEIDKYIKDNFTIDKEQLDRLGIEEKDYMYSMDRGDILAMVRHFANLQKQRMMKDTVVMEAHEEYGELWGDITKCSTEKGKKYKVIILKM